MYVRRGQPRDADRALAPVGVTLTKFEAGGMTDWARREALGAPLRERQL
jgi:hypothetical protein